MAARIKLRRDTSQNWTTANPILAAGETGFEIDTRMIKLGDGSTRWNSLPYAVTGDLQITNSTIAGKTSVDISVGTGDDYNWIVSIDGSEGIPNNEGIWPTAPNAVTYDSQGNAYMAYWYTGIITSVVSGASVVKIDPTGNMIWTQYFQENRIVGGGLAVDKNDDVILAVTETNNTQSNSVSVLKLHSLDGTIAWQTAFVDSVANNDVEVGSVETDSLGNIFVSGYSTYPAGPISVWLLKLNNSNGAIIWNNVYYSVLGEGDPEISAGIAVDINNDVALLGTLPYGGSNNIGVVKVNGSTGIPIWEIDVAATAQPEVHNFDVNEIYPGDIASDNLGNFYVTFSGNETDGSTTTNVTKIIGNGTVSWSRVVGQASSLNQATSVDCDSSNNVYVYNTVYNLVENVGRYYEAVTKFNPYGTVIWSNVLSKEQDSEYNYYPTFTGGEKLLSVNANYLLIGGQHYPTKRYEQNSENYTGPFLYNAFAAQVDNNGNSMSIDGWSFVPLSQVIGNTSTISPIALEALPSTSTYFTASNVTVTSSYITIYPNVDGIISEQLDTARTKTLAFTGNQLELPSGSSLTVSRENIGYVGMVGNFDGSEGGSNQGDLFFNSVTRDTQGNSFVAGGWSDYANPIGESDYGTVPFLMKFDSQGKSQWQITPVTFLDNGGGTMGSVESSIRTDGSITWLSLDGDEGFNIANIDSVSGNIIGTATNIRSYLQSNNEGDSNADLYPAAMTLMSDNTPVVVGWINYNSDVYPNVADGGATTATGTTDSILVIPESTFNRGVYPNEDGSWYVLNTNTNVFTAIEYVNRYGFEESGFTATNISSTGSGATFWIQTNPANGVYSLYVYNGGGANYNNGDTLKITGNMLGGAISTNDATITVVGVTDGAITTATVAGVGSTATIKLDVNTDIGFVTLNTNTFNVYELTDTNGFVWTPNWNSSIGATNTNDSLLAVAVDTQDNVIVGGYYENTGVPNSTSYYSARPQTGFVAQYSSTGSLRWSTTIDGIEGQQTVYQVVTDSSDNIYALAEASWETYYNWPTLSKISSTGTVEWTTVIQTYYNGGIAGLSIDENDNLYVSTHAYTPENYLSDSDAPVSDQAPYVSIDGAEGLITFKFDTDGNKLFERNLVSVDSIFTDYYQPFGSNISVNNDRISVVGYSQYSGDNDNGIIADLPANGNGLGTIGDHFVYAKSETNLAQFGKYFEPADSLGNTFTPATRYHYFTVTNFSTGTSLSIYLDRSVKTSPVYDTTGGTINGVAGITFEDGTTQTTSAQDVPRSDLSWTNNSNYTIQLQDRGHHIYNDNVGNNYYYIPSDALIDFPIGSVVTFVVTGQNIRIYPKQGVTIYGAGQGGTNVTYNGSPSYWVIPAWGIATIMKYDANTWMLSGTGITAN
jgi:hypothetical protein